MTKAAKKEPPIEQVRAELAALGIDTTAAVKKVQDAVALSQAVRPPAGDFVPPVDRKSMAAGENDEQPEAGCPF